MVECEVIEPPECLHYTTQHLWLKRQAANVWALGITEFAQDQLGDVVYASLPKPGDMYTKGSTVAVLESVKSASDIIMPVNGTVRLINPLLADRPELINQQPYQSGWLFSLSPHQQIELQNFLSAADYDAWLDR